MPDEPYMLCKPVLAYLHYITSVWHGIMYINIYIVALQYTMLIFGFRESKDEHCLHT